MEEITKKKILVIGAGAPANVNRLLAADNLDVEFIDDIKRMSEGFGLIYHEEAKKHLEMIKEYDSIQYSHLSKKEREADIKPIRNSKTDPKHGRNELCPCGSGKKYKRCCFVCS
jgi:preprotein translocase subunit SecA